MSEHRSTGDDALGRALNFVRNNLSDSAAVDALEIVAATQRALEARYDNPNTVRLEFTRDELRTLRVAIAAQPLAEPEIAISRKLRAAEAAFRISPHVQDPLSTTYGSAPPRASQVSHTQDLAQTHTEDRSLVQRAAEQARASISDIRDMLLHHLPGHRDAQQAAAVQERKVAQKLSM